MQRTVEHGLDIVAAARPGSPSLDNLVNGALLNAVRPAATLAAQDVLDTREPARRAAQHRERPPTPKREAVAVRVGVGTAPELTASRRPSEEVSPAIRAVRQ